MTDGDDTLPASPLAKARVSDRYQIRELMMTWVRMASPRRMRLEPESKSDIMWAIVSDERGFTSRTPLAIDEDPFKAWARAMGDLPRRA